MNKQLRFVIFNAILSLILSGSFQLYSKDIKTNGEGEARLEFLSTSELQVTLRNTVDHIALEGIGRFEGDFVKLVIRGYGQSYEVGMPNLPVKRRLIEIPAGAEPVVKVIGCELKEYDLADFGTSNRIIPVQPPQPKCGNCPEFKIDNVVYNQDEYLANDIVNVDVLGFMRGVRIARINIHPIEYNPVENKIRVYEDLVFEISFQNADLIQTETLKQKHRSIYFESIFRQIANYKQAASRENLTQYPVKYLIVSDPMFESQLQSFINWKKQKGFTVLEAYTDEIGETKAEIKDYIQDLYEEGNEEDPAPSFVLFVGDIAQIPAWDNGNGVTDRNYVEYTGDLFPEIFYGRFSAENSSQLQPYIDKSLQYEQYTMPDPSYLEEVVMVAGMDGSHGADWGNGQINYGTINYFNEEHDILSHTYLYPQSGDSEQEIIGDISDGVTFGNYTAHCSPSGWGDPSFVISDIPSLQNQDKYGLLIGNCCSSSEFQTTCFAEEILRAENKGAVGYIGGSNSTYWDEDYYFGVGVGEISETPPPYEETTPGNYDRSFHDHGEPFGDWYTTMDQAVFAGNIAVSESGSSMEEYYWDIYNLMGDPSLMIFYGVPDEIQADHNSMLMVGESEFEIETEPFAYVAMNLDGENISTAIADENGNVSLGFEALSAPGSVELVYTAQNFQPLIEEVMIIAPDGPFCIYSEHTINDDSLGNGNNHPEFDEKVFLSVTIENYGTEDAYNVNAVIESDNPYVTILDDQETYDTILSDQAVTRENGFLVKLADDIPDQAGLTFNLIVTDEQDSSWTSDFSIVVNAPVLSAEKITVVDDDNDNGMLDPGETAKLKIKTVNRGHCPAIDVTALLEAYNPYITVIDNDTVIPSLGLLGAAYPEFMVEVDEDAPTGIFGQMRYQLISGGYELVRNYYPKIGMLLEDWETGNMNKFDWQNSGDADWGINMQYPYEGIFDLKSGEIEDDQVSAFSVNYEVMTNDSIIFYKKVSSEEDYDFLNFYIDNNLKGKWSGTTQGWSREAFAVSPGIHMFKWSYEKDYYLSGGTDCAWIDYIMLPTMMVTTVYAGPDDQICIDGEYFQCLGSATNYDTIYWSASGTGTFDNPNSFYPQYSFSQADIETGYVNLALNLIDKDGYPESDTMMLIFSSAPVQPETPNGPDKVNLTEVTETEYTVDEVEFADEYNWSLFPEESGSIEGNGISATIYWDIQYYGEAYVKVAAMNGCGEGPFSDSLAIVVSNPVGIPEDQKSPDLTILPNPNTGIFKVNISSDSPTMIKVSVINFLGQSVLTGDQFCLYGKYTEKVDLSGVEPGVYMVVVQSENRKIVKKLIISK